MNDSHSLFFVAEQKEVAQHPFSLRALFSYPFLLAVAFLVDLLVPMLISLGLVPGAVRWLSDLAIVTMIGLTVARLLVFKRVPAATFLMVGVTVIGAIVAASEGQASGATIWGWWVMFRFPLLGLYAYLHTSWPPNFVKGIIWSALGLSAFEVLVQIYQYATGVVPGDFLAGTFGPFATGSLVMLHILVLSLALGYWLATNSWLEPVLALVLGSFSSVLGEMKLFPFAILLLAAAAAAIYLWRGGKFRVILIYTLGLSVSIVIFIFLYNLIVGDAGGAIPLESFFDPTTLDKYLNHNVYDPSSGGYDLGRSFWLSYGWQTVQKDLTTTLFGMGIGAGNESISFGVKGVAVLRGYYGQVSGTSLVVLLQEIGLVGLTIFGLLVAWVVLRLLISSHQDSNSEISPLRYGLILFSVGWPLWLWYTGIWGMSITLLYWALLGYVLRHDAQRQDTQRHDGQWQTALADRSTDTHDLLKSPAALI